MASIIRIKRSSVSGNPSTLAAGELAYSGLSDNGSNGGDRLYIGMGTETNGNAVNHIVIGGQYFTDKLDHNPGTLTASSAIIVDSNSKIDLLNVDNLRLDSNSITSTDANGDINIAPNGTGKVFVDSNLLVSGDLTVQGTINATIEGTSSSATALASSLTLSFTNGGGDVLGSTTFDGSEGTIDVELTLDTVNSDVGTYGSATEIPVVTVDAKGRVTAVSTSTVATTLSLSADGSSSSADLLNDTLTIDGGNGIDTSITDSTITVEIDTAVVATLADTQTLTNKTLDTATNTITGLTNANLSGTAAISNANLANSKISVAGDTGTYDVSLGGTQTIAGAGAISTAASAGTTTISVAAATTSSLGVASFDGNQFTVNTGAVSLKTGGIPNSALANDSVTLGTTTLALGATSATLAGLTSVTSASFVGTLTGNADTATTLATARNINGVAFDGSANITVTADAGTLTGTELNSTVVTSSLTSVGTIGTGVWQGTAIANDYLANNTVTIGSTTVTLGQTQTALAGLTELTVDNLDFNGNEISSTDTNGDIVLNPNGTGNIDVSGARITNVAAPTANSDAVNKAYVDNAVTGLDWKSAVNLLADTNVALTGSTSTLVIDSHSALDQTDDGVYRILLTSQTTSTENGIYTYTDNGTTYTLVRADDADTYQELVGTSVYVMEGTVYGKTGWVQTNHYLTDFSGQVWTQFAGAGAYVAGDALSLTGTTFDVNVATLGGLEIAADALQLKSTVSGNGLTLTSGVLDVVGTADRITANADSIDIASTYVGQTSITTLGTITTGTWNGTTIAVANGGTGATSLTSNGILYGNGTGAVQATAAGTDGYFLKSNNGTPEWTNTIDGGTY